jgi:hypothetical protein
VKFVLIYLAVLFDQPMSGAPEFDTLAACKGAAKEMRKQAAADPDGVKFPILLCAAKGTEGAAR